MCTRAQKPKNPSFIKLTNIPWVNGYDMIKNVTNWNKFCKYMSSGALPDIWWSNLHLPMLWQMAMKWFDWLKLLDTFCQGVLLEGVPWVRTRLHHLMGMHSLSLERLKLDYRSIGFPRSTPLKSKPEQPSPPCSSSSASRWSLTIVGHWSAIVKT